MSSFGGWDADRDPEGLRRWLHNVAAFNAAFATIQLAIGLGLLWQPAVKAALAGTIGWGLAVWLLGEGLGGILTGSASPLSGAPGAAVLYALLAVLIWPRPPLAGVAAHGRSPARSVAAASPLGPRWSRLPWLLLWESSAGKVFCLVEAPSADAAATVHREAHGLVADGIFQVQEGS